MIANLEKSLYQFSAAKNYQQLKDITSALKDPEGNIRSFKEFRDIANKISFQYNTEWLQTEYNTAIGCGQMAGRWVDFEKNAESMPYLQYVTAGDNRVREEHAVLDGVTKRINDEFWSKFYPPNGYNCRCDVIQVPGEAEETNTDNLKMPGIPEMFQTNTAKQGLVFSKKHPYYTGVPKEVITEADKMSKAKITEVKKKKNEPSK
jgi:SPP1 gp7 family putative phage head morphogenesis protein